jgi:hypothetical protein
MTKPDISEFSAVDLLRLPYAAIDELKHRGIVRTSNAPLGDYAEYIVAKTYNGTLEKNSAKSFDILFSDGKTCQVKARRMNGRSGDCLTSAPMEQINGIA